MPGWFSLQAPTPPELGALTGTVSGGLHAVKSAVEAARTAAQVSAAGLTAPDGPTVVAFNSLVQGAVSAASSALDALLDDAGVYVLLVPLPKKGALALLPEERGAGASFIDAPSSNLLKDPTTPRDAFASPSWQRAFDPETVYLGGNAWFLRQVAEALHDRGDDNRPKFDATSAWAYTMFVAGGGDVTAVLSAAKYFARLFGSGRGACDLPPDRNAASVVPGGVKVGPSSRSNTAVVSWDVAPITSVIAAFDDAVVAATHYAVIRSTDFRARAATKVSDLFSGTLREGLEGAFGAKVVKLSAYDGVTSRWADPGPLVEGRDYYYHVAFRTEVRAPDDGSRVDLGFEELSSCAPFRLDGGGRTNPRSAGNPPDWVRTRSVARTMPAVAAVIDRIKEQIITLAASANNATNQQRAFVDFLGREVDRYAARANELTQYVDRVAAVSLRPTAAIGAYVGKGVGGTGAFLADVARALDDTEDPERPSFDDGTEYVTGVMLLAVGPDPDAVARTLAAFELFFGSADQDPVLAGIESVNAQLAAQETALITEVSAPTAFDLAMNPTTGPDAGCRT